MSFHQLSLEEREKRKREFIKRDRAHHWKQGFTSGLIVGLVIGFVLIFVVTHIGTNNHCLSSDPQFACR